MENNNNFNIKEVLKKVVEELNRKINIVINPNQKKKAMHNKKEFFIKKDMHKDFPISKDTYYNYNAFVNAEKPSKNIKSIDLSVFYYICKYTDVSADYLLGFIESKRKEQSAEMVRKEFGLSDDAMDNLSRIKNRTPEYTGEVSSDIINTILESRVFLQKLDDHLPVYLSCLNESRAADIDIDMARYGLTRAFEELIDEICNNITKKNLSFKELDESGIIYS
ncbi:MAG: hypothetical protein HFE30_01600 [Clostridiales bacterium]|nr:hypothetical protein [Clostridiales bacterium]